jgi:hypothetical protein
MSPTLPRLPTRDNNEPWPPNVYAAYNILSDSTSHISRVLNQEDLDPSRLKHHAEILSSDTFRVLESLEKDNSGLPIPWFELCADYLAHLFVDLVRAAHSADGQ